jgi:alkylhydroperoxidase family enzyme
MAYIRTIGASEAEGELSEAYAAMAARPMPAVYRPPHGDAPGILRAHSLDARLVRLTFAVSGTLATEATLSWTRRELINAVTSRQNGCFY